MKIRLLAICLLCISVARAQEVIPLYNGKPSGSEKWDWDEGEMHSDIWQTRVVYNVSKPTLTAYLPPASTANGTAVVICPGGAFHALSIDSEGIDVAKWLNARGIAAFVLKYRLVRSETQDPIKEVSAKMTNTKKFDADNARVIPLAIADGLEAIRYVRKNAAQFRVNPERIGIVGFSAGGTVAAGVTFQGKGDSRPDFVAPVYAYIPASLGEKKIPAEAPPMFIVAASDDQLGLAAHSVSLYQKWLEARRPVEMHLYAQGGHGFGMRTQWFPSDAWIDRYYEWLDAQGFLLPANSEHTPQQLKQRRRETDAKASHDWANLGLYREENEKLGPPAPGENRIVFMGNSITARWSRTHPEFFENKPYINRGIGGQTTQQLLVRFRQDVIDLKPKVVVILAGINDIARNNAMSPPEVIMDNIASMAMLANAHGIKVILSSVLPAYDFLSRPGLEPAGKVIALNKLIKRFAEQNDFYYLDYFTAMVDERQGLKKEYSNDEVHPTLEGYKVMEPLVQRAIDTVLREN